TGCFGALAGIESHLQENSEQHLDRLSCVATTCTRPNPRANVCLEAGTGKQVWQTNTVTGLHNGASIHMTPCGEAVFLFTDQGHFTRPQLTPQGYREISRAHLLKPTSPSGNRKCAWTPPAY